MTDELLDELKDDSSKTTVNLADVSALARKQLEIEAEVAKAEATLKDAKARLRKIQEGELPAALKAAGIPSFTLDNGMTVSYAEDLKCEVPKKNKGAVIAKMTEWGFAANVAHVLTVDLGTGNKDNAVTALKAIAEEMGVEATLAEDIPTGTVKKVLRQRIKEGKSDDLALFGAFQFTKATVK